jgi:rod shape determining protein RodA
MRNWLVIICLVLLMAIGLTTLHSLAPELVSRQVLFWVLGFAIFFASASLPFNQWLKLGKISLIGLITLLVVVLFVAETRETARWFHIFGFSFQPSQLALPVLSIYTASILTKSHLKYFDKLWSYLAIIAIPLFLIFIEPDLGTVIITLATLGFSLIICGLQTKILIKFFWTGCILLGIGWLFLLQPYQKARLTSFMSPETQVTDANYNAKQALISVGAGGLIGRGAGLGSQSQLKFLPEKHTDFIFAALAEETGLVGTALVLIIYLTIIFFLLSRSQTQPLPTKFTLVSVAVWITLQTSVNVGMNMGLLPITGLTLPFISYGGSSLLSSLWWLGIAKSASAWGDNKSELHLS